MWLRTAFLALCMVSKPSKLPLWCQERRQMLVKSFVSFYLGWLHSGERVSSFFLLPQPPSGKGERRCGCEVCLAGDPRVTEHGEEGNEGL